MLLQFSGMIENPLIEFKNRLPEHNPFKRLENEMFLQVFSDLQIQKFAPNTKVFESGQSVFGVFQIVTGVLKVHQSIHDALLTVRMAGDGDWAGHRSIFTSLKYRGTAVTKTDVEAYLVPTERIHQLILIPQFADAFIRMVCTDLEASEKTIYDYQRLSVPNRLLNLFKKLNQRFGQKSAEGFVTIPFKLSKVEIANMIGASEEVVIRQLSDWRKKGLLQEEGKQFSLSDEILNRVTR